MVVFYLFCLVFFGINQTYCQDEIDVQVYYSEDKIIETKGTKIYVMLGCENDSISIYVNNKYQFGKKVVNNPAIGKYYLMGTTLNQISCKDVLSITFHKREKKIERSFKTSVKELRLYACIVSQQKNKSRHSNNKKTDDMIELVEELDGYGTDERIIISVK